MSPLPSHSPQIRSPTHQPLNQPQLQTHAPQPHPHSHAHANGSTPSPVRARQTRPPTSHSSRASPANPSYQPHESARGRTLTYEDLSRCFHLPINSAAKELGVCVTALKKQCRKHQIKRWPHRKLKSLDKLKEKLEKEEANAADKEYYKHEIHSIVQKKDHIFRSGTNPTRESPPQPDNSELQRTTPPLSEQRINNRTSQSFPSHDHAPVHGHPPPLMISTPVSLPGRTVTLQAPHPPQPQGAIGPPTLTPVTMQAPPISLCGVIGCDCYMNGGVSSQNYHMPLPARPPLPANNGALVPAVPVSVSGPMHTNAPFYGPTPAPYPYATAVPYPPPQPTPFQNMVQVNVLEQQPYGHQPGPAQTPSQTTPPGPRSAPPNGSPLINGSPNIIQAGQMTVSQSSTPTATPNPSPYEGYPATSSGTVSQPPGGFLYGPFPPHTQIPVEGVVQGAQSNGSAAIVPHYWTEPPHTSNRSNLVTMYNQTTHYHHHHAANARPTAGGHVEGTASSATNNSDAADSRRHSIHINGNGASSAPTGAGLSSRNALQRPVESMCRKRGPSPSESRPAKFVKSDAGDATEGCKGSSPGDRGESTREALRVGAIEKRNASDEFKNGSRLEMTIPRRESEMRNDKPTVSNKSGPKPSEPRPRIERMEQRQAQREETGRPRIVGNVAPENRVSRSIASGDGEEKRVNVTVGECKRMEGMRSDNGQILNRIGAASGSRRSPNKRPRNGMVESGGKGKSWEGAYLTAGNTGVPAVRHAEGEGGLREITPPSDREETPFDPRDNLGSGTGSGSGSGSGSGNENDNGGSAEGDGTGSGSGSGDGTGSGDGGMDPPSPRRNGMKRRSGHGIEWRMNGSDDGNTMLVRARRYEHVVHHCVSLLCAQWCTDKSLRVVISLGSKVLLGLAGIGGHGRNIFEGCEDMLESKHCMQKRYNTVLKGQRLEWVATNGRKRYLMVLSPFRKRSGAEISGVSGLLMELTQVGDS